MCSLNAAPLFSLPATVDPGIPTSVSGIDHIVAAWVAEELGMPVERFGPCSAVGIVYRGQIIAGVVYNNYHCYAEGAVIEGSIASSTPLWATRKILKDIFAYPFEQMKATRFQVVCKKSNKHGRQFVVRLGFKMEGVARRLWNGKCDAVLYSMLPSENRWT